MNSVIFTLQVYHISLYANKRVVGIHNWQRYKALNHNDNNNHTLEGP